MARWIQAHGDGSDEDGNEQKGCHGYQGMDVITDLKCKKRKNLDKKRIASSCMDTCNTGHAILI